MRHEALHIVMRELTLFSSGNDEVRYVIKRQVEFPFSAVVVVSLDCIGAIPSVSNSHCTLSVTNDKFLRSPE